MGDDKANLEKLRKGVRVAHADHSGTRAFSLPLRANLRQSKLSGNIRSRVLLSLLHSYR